MIIDGSSLMDPFPFHFHMLEFNEKFNGNKLRLLQIKLHGRKLKIRTV